MTILMFCVAAGCNHQAAHKSIPSIGGEPVIATIVKEKQGAAPEQPDKNLLFKEKQISWQQRQKQRHITRDWIDKEIQI